MKRIKIDPKKIIKLPYTGCSIIQEEVGRIYAITIYGGAYSSSDLNDPLQVGVIGGGGQAFDPWSHNFK